MDFKSEKMTIDTIRKLSEALPKDAGFITHVLANIWLIVPFVTILLFTLMEGILSGNTIQYMQLFYVVLTIGISFYFVDKNAHQSKGDAVLSATHNALMLYSIITLVIQFNPCAKCMSSQMTNMIQFAIMVICFNILAMMSNKNSSSQSSFLVILGLIVFQIIKIYLTAK